MVRILRGDNRYLGYREALTNADHAFHPELVVDAMGTDCSEYTRGFEGMLKLLMARTRPDGVMAYSDIMAVGAIDAALSRNIKIPEGIAFVGCEIIPWFARCGFHFRASCCRDKKWGKEPRAWLCA